jgi:hypothetical protein
MLATLRHIPCLDEAGSHIGRYSTRREFRDPSSIDNKHVKTSLPRFLVTGDLKSEGSVI